ncbi:MAG TPA: DUF1476 domain-containing protein [Alphaproteobacteria bacterium]|nr:DUF1476 domain-containing protein [Alphaproteobacteria bacterium]
MSNIFDDREKNFEAKYRHDEELRFKIQVRRDKLIGLWAASKIGLASKDAEAYAKALIEKNLMKHVDEHLVETLGADFKAHNLEISPHRIRRHLEECLEEARAEVMKDIR